MLFGVEPLCFSSSGCFFLVGYEVVAVALVDFGVKDSSFRGCLELCDVEE